MRIDKSIRSTHAHLTANESFFLACWYNLGHEESLDSERVSVLNPMVGLQELLDLYHLGSTFGGDQKRLDVAFELRGILERSSVLQHPIYQNIPAQLIECFSDKNNDHSKTASPKHINKSQILISSLARHLLTLLKQHYIQDTFTLLEEAITSSNYSDWSTQSKHFLKIRYLSEDLASALIWRGAGLWELHSFYQNILITDLYDSSCFKLNFNNFKTKALQSDRQYVVRFTIRSEGLVKAITRQGNTITFDGFKLNIKDARDAIAETTIKTMSASIAGSQAHESLANALDVFGYMLGRERIDVQKTYSSTDMISQATKSFVIRRPFNNPAYELPQDKFSKLINSLGTASETEGHRDNKILAAFRLYRIGSRSENLEAKFVTYWSALESLTRDASHPSGFNDDKVACTLSPCVVVDYVNKRLTSYLKALHHIDHREILTESHGSIDLSRLSNVGFFELLRDRAQATKLVNSLDQYPYFKFQLSRFADVCQDQARLLSVLKKHRNKVILQVKRIYRARNLITHTGSRVESLEFLCANLEHYLKTCVNCIIDLISEIRTIKTPEESLTRYDLLLKNAERELTESGSTLESFKLLLRINQ